MLPRLSGRSVEPYGYLVKPFTDRDLHTAIQVALGRAQRDRALQRQHDDLQAILDVQRQGLILIDERGQVTFVNRAAAQMLALSPQAAVGHPWPELFRDEPAAGAEIGELLERPSADPAGRLPAVHLGGPPVLVVEVEVLADPRNERNRIVSLHDVSRISALEQKIEKTWSFEQLLGKSSAMQHVFQLVREVARVDSIVTIEGATGTGKELVARAIHNLSARRDQPFVALNCAGLGDELAASQLFGHRRGAFTGALEDQLGLFEAAGGGTLFLDEIGELSVRVQTTMLRALEERRIMRLGDSATREFRARIITATNRDLAAEVAAGRFRADLMYRIRVARIPLPALKSRREDIPLLARAFVAEHALVMGKRLRNIDDEALALLLQYDWPGNVRELRNALEHAVLRAAGHSLAAADLPPEIRDALESDTLLGSLSSDDREGLLAAIERAGGNRKEAAQLLGISRATFYRRLSQFGLGEAGEPPSNPT